MSGAAASTDRYPVAAMTAIVLASLVVLMDTTFIVLALPVIAQSAYNRGFLVSAGIAAVGLVLARLLPRRPSPRCSV